MDVLEAIHTRRSIRKYEEGRDISEEQVRTLLAAAMTAPSAGNAQPWHFVVVRDPAIRERLSRTHPYVGMAATAPVVVVVCAEPALEKYPGYWVQDCSAATQNLLLAACDLGLGTVWTGLYPMEERCKAVAEILNLPQGVIPLSLVPVGHPVQEFKHQDRYKEERVHRETW